MTSQPTSSSVVPQALARLLRFVRAAAAVLVVVRVANAADDPQPSTLATLKAMSFEELVNFQVTSVSKRAQKLGETAAAIEVITQSDVRRSGAVTLPEALRLAGSLELAQLNAAQWQISARGFNAPLSNKMLVLIDGRSVYSPLFSGVFWEAQDVLFEDLERIEVISGPGATVWGANAVNGVINITRKSARDTQGLYLEAGGGTNFPWVGALRYGSEISSRTHFRVYGLGANRDSTVLATGADPGNDWAQRQGGFRVDSETANGDLLTLQGDLFENTIEVPPEDIVMRGANVLARWSHDVSADSGFKLQVFVDRVRRDANVGYDNTTDTYDLDFQHQLTIGERQAVVWGAGYRLVRDDFDSGTIAFLHERVSLNTFSAFVQDEIALVPDVLHLTLGTKIEENDYTGVELQPGVRLAWQLREKQMVWAAVSRALRTPARLDREYYLPPTIVGSPDLQSEKLLAYELGYRVQPHERVSVSLAGYYNDYDDIRSFEPANPPAPLPVVFGNGQEGESYGLELSLDYYVTDAWRLHAGLSELRLHVRPQPGSFDNSFGRAEAADSKHHALLRSSLDLSRNLQLDATYRYVSRVTNPDVAVPGYSELDLRIAWLATDSLEVSIVGQNLLHDRHPELGVVAARQEMERGAYAKIAWRH